MASRSGGKSPTKTPKSKSPRKKDQTNATPSPKASPRTKATCDVSRRLRDLCATWHELVQKWNNHNTLAFNVANSLMNLQLQREYSDVDSPNSVAVLRDFTDSTSSELDENVMKYFEELSQIISKMSQICSKMASITESFKAAEKLGNLKGKNENNEENECYFTTWPVCQFYCFSEKLCKMYQKELELKEKLVPHFTRSKDRNELMVYLSLWLHQPYLSDEKELLLESMLTETGLR